jgi:organic hydroperoxide reductase OsmC/OhrA
MWTYKTSVNWTSGKSAVIGCETKPEIVIATPPEFGGPAGCWSPEDLLASSVASCVMMSALFFIAREKIELSSYETQGTATMEKNASGLTITGIALDLQIVLKNPEQEPLLRKAIQRAEQTCPISGALKCPVTILLNVS